MVYLNPEALRQMHADLADFFDRAVASAQLGGLNRAGPVPATPARRRPPGGGTQ